MKKIRILTIISLLIVIIIIISSISYFNNEFKNKSDLIYDVFEELKINEDILNIRYLKGNMLDDKLSYGNKVTKIIELENKTDKLLSYAICLEESELTKNALIYNIYISDEEKGSYIELSKKVQINKDQALIYNLGIEPGEKQFIKIEFIANEEVNTIIKGVLKVKSNLTDKDIFEQELNLISSVVNEKIDNINGINESGYYIIDINDLNLGDKTNLKGFLLIDATDISQLEYYYSIYNNTYMLKHYKFDDMLKNNSLLTIDSDYTSSLNFDNVCREHTKKECLRFDSLKYNKEGGKEKFLNNLNKVISLVEANFNKKNKKVYIYDVLKDIDNSTNIRGYVLINNTLDKPEYYLYLTNDIFMVSGYNMTKYGQVNINATTIRAYNETAFKLSSESISKVCTFSGFRECYNLQEEKV